MTSGHAPVAIIFAAATLLVSAGCGTAEPRTVYVVGDSTMAQVEDVTGFGSTKSGCGFTAHADCLIPLDDVAPPDAEVIVAAVSIWDVGATPEEIADGYGAYHDQLTALAPTVWVGLPPVFGLRSDDPANRAAEDLNAAVSGALGCEVEHWSLRKSSTVDGVHYDRPGARRVAGRLGTLSATDACTPA